MKNSFVAAFILLFFFQAYSQPHHKLDSLKKIALKTNDAQTYYDLYASLSELDKHDSAFIYLQKAVAHVKDKKLEAKIRNSYSGSAQIKGFYSLAQQQAFNSLELSLELRDSLLISSAYNSLASIADETGLQEKAIQYYEEGLRYDPKDFAIKNNMANTLVSQKNLFKAVGIYQELLNKYPRNDSLGIAIAHNNIGDAFLELKNFDSALTHIRATLAISTALHDSSGLMFDNKLMGKYWLSQAQYKKAKSCFYFSLRLNEKFGEKEQNWLGIELPALYRHMVDIYTRDKNMDSVIWFKDKLIEYQKFLLDKQKKSTAEFIFSDQESELKAFVQRQDQARKGLTEYYGIALILLFIAVIYFLFTGKDKQRKYAPYLSIIILILTFEFLLVVLDPLINRVTSGEPMYDFVINVSLALTLIPLQHFGEKIFKKFALDIRLKKMDEKAA